MVDNDWQLQPYLKERVRLVDSALDRFLPGVAILPTRLHTAIRYSVFARGKRIRPILMLAACEAAGVSRRTADHWRRVDALGFTGRLETAKAGFGDRLESLAWDLVKKMKPGSNPTLLICLLNATLPAKYRVQTALDPATARDTLSELRQLANSGPGPTEAGTEDRAAAAVAEAERLLGTRSEPGAGVRLPRAEPRTDGGQGQPGTEGGPEG